MTSTASGIFNSILKGIKNDDLQKIKQDQKSPAGLLDTSSPSCLLAAKPEPLVIKAVNQLSDLEKE